MQGRLVPSEKKKSIQYFPSKNWKKEIKIASENNLNILEWTINLENMLKNPIYNGNVEEIIKLKKKYNIEIPSITVDYFMQKPFFKYKQKKTQEFIKNNLVKIIKNSEKVKIKYIIFPLVDNGSIKSMKEENLLILEIKKMIRILNKKTKILFETDYKPNKVIKFIKKFNSQKIGINYDSGNSAGLGYSFEQEKKYLKYVHNIHIKDKIFKGKTVRLGQGNWDYITFFNYVKKKYKKNFILQTARAKDNKHIKEILINKNFILKYL